MVSIHDAAFRSDVKNRINALSPHAKRQWGKMTIDQMLWHVSEGFELALGRREYGVTKGLMPYWLMKFMVLSLPWPKGRTPTLPPLVAKGNYDVEAERARCLRLIDELAQKDLASQWPYHPLLGQLTGQEHSHLQGKHVEYHLRQFGA